MQSKIGKEMNSVLVKHQPVELPTLSSTSVRDKFLPVIAAPCTLELVEDAVVLVQSTQFTAQIVVNWQRFNRPRLHVHIPDFHRQIIPCHHVPTTMAEANVGNAGNYL